MSTISIIIPVYQAENTIEKCVESCAMAMKGFDGEIILVDDGSRDASGQICDDLAARYGSDPKTDCDPHKSTERTAEDRSCTSELTVKVIHTPNGGVSQARNTGLKQSVGDFVTFVDADDLVLPDYIQRLMEGFGEAASSEGESFDDSNEAHLLGKHTTGKGHDIWICDMNDLCQGVITGFDYLENSVLEGNVHVWAKMFRRDKIKNLTFMPGLTIGEDMLFVLQAAISAGNQKHVSCIPSGSYTYVENEQGAMKSAFKMSYTDEIKSWQKAEELLEPVKTLISPFSFTKLANDQILTALLVAGKAAVSLAATKTSGSGSTRDASLDQVSEAEVKASKEAMDAVDMARGQIKHALKRNGAFASLSVGHKLKVMLLLLNKKLYIKLYGNYKK